MSGFLTRRVLVSTFVRSFLIQGSWNYRTMLGSGFGFAMIPGLRRVFGEDPDGLCASMRRHMEHFNAHPYLTGIALGASLRLEAEGADAEAVRRLKAAIRGPLGSIGDAFVWATVLPGASALALCVIWSGLPTWAGVATFLIGFNAVHVSLRLWGFRAGLRAGRDVGRTLAGADLAGWTRRLRPVVALLLGALSGALLGAEGGLVEAGAPWAALGVAAFIAGLLGGHKTWRPAAALTVIAIGTVAAYGVLA